MTRVNSGIKFEYFVRDYFLGKGYQVMRSAGSHGPADLIAWRFEDVRLVQCKKEGSPKSYAEDMLKLIGLPVPSGWKKQIWVKRGKDVVVTDVVSGESETILAKVMRV